MSAGIVCDSCGTETPLDQIKRWFMRRMGPTMFYCPTCWPMVGGDACAIRKET